ncbi:hypothetical protein Vadar_018359 [Vaccinium darrowii]|uniref:Uncharacterized protein n=1 Tax=Vaccinium darrowii TaxID=229202 RepID=A0ACB7XRW8_9ERIC|nr:hypothetical protein Vadar_018359 [Vaccinium darrowii]
MYVLLCCRKQAVRVFSSAPILKRNDPFTLETVDGIIVIIRNCLNEVCTKENGFPSEVFCRFVFGFPTNWEAYAENCLGEELGTKDVSTMLGRNELSTNSGSVDDRNDGTPDRNKADVNERHGTSDKVDFCSEEKGHHKPQHGACNNSLLEDPKLRSSQVMSEMIIDGASKGFDLQNHVADCFNTVETESPVGAAIESPLPKTSDVDAAHIHKTPSSRNLKSSGKRNTPEMNNKITASPQEESLPTGIIVEGCCHHTFTFCFTNTDEKQEQVDGNIASKAAKQSKNTSKTLRSSVRLGDLKKIADFQVAGSNKEKNVQNASKSKEKTNRKLTYVRKSGKWKPREELRKLHFCLQNLHVSEDLDQDRKITGIQGLRDVEVSGENLNDNTSSGSLEAVFAQKAVDTASGQMEQLPHSSETLEPERARKNGKCNLRKSLAWDSAFFTSAGFLEPDELSSMIKGADKCGKPLLPGIEEDMRRSTDSISTLESESLTLESLEADFFEDIRASIQKSSKASNRTSSSVAAPRETDTQSICPSKKLDLASKNMPVASNGGMTSSVPKPPKVIGKPNPILSAPLKRASLDANKFKRENDKTKGSSVPSCKMGPVSKVSGLGGPFRTVPKPATSTKSSSVSSVDDGKGISPVKSTRRLDAKTVNPVSSSSTLKNPSKVPLKKKGQAQLTLSKQASKASPASSFSEWSSVSSSSTSSVNQRSSSSRVSIDTSSPCRSLDSDAPPALGSHCQRNDQTSMYENKVNPKPSENQERASIQSGVLSRPATVQPTGLRMPSPKIGFFDGVKPVDRTPKGSMQSHSGIQPRPKIGARISNPNGVSSKANNTKLQPSRTVTATGSLKLDSKKSASPVLLPSQKPLNASPKVSNVSRSLNKNRGISAQSQNEIDGESCLKAVKVVCEGSDREKSKSPGVSKSEVNFEKQDNTKLMDINVVPAEGDTYLSSHLNAEKIKSTEKVGEDANFGPQQPENNLNSLCKGDENKNAHFEEHVEKQDNTKLMDINVVPAEGDTYLSSHLNAEKVKSTEKVGEDANFSPQQPENNLNSLCKGDEYKNDHFEDHVEGLSMSIGAMVSNQDVQKEVVGNSVSQIDPNHLDSELSCLEEYSCLGKEGGSPSNLLGPTLISLSPATCEINVSARTPLAVKNYFNEDDLPTRLSIGVVEKIASVPLESAQMENS